MLRDLSCKSGIGVHYTNHSCRAESITCMFNNGLPEKVIAETSGHRSVKALRCYEGTSSTQQQAVTASVNVVGQDVDSVVVNKTKASSKLPKGIQSFSGNFTNCTMNNYFLSLTLFCGWLVVVVVVIIRVCGK